MLWHTVSPNGHRPLDSVLPCTAVQCSAPCTLSSSSYYLAVLVTDPPDAKFNLLKNPPIDQTTTLQLNHHAKADNSYPRLSPGKIEDLFNGKQERTRS